MFDWIANNSVLTIAIVAVFCIIILFLADRFIEASNKKRAYDLQYSRKLQKKMENIRKFQDKTK